MVLTKKLVFAVQKQCINLINPILFPHVQFANYVVQRKNVDMTIIANIHSRSFMSLQSSSGNSGVVSGPGQTALLREAARLFGAVDTGTR